MIVKSLLFRYLTRQSRNQRFSGSSEKFVGNFLGSLALYSSVHTGMTKVVLSVIFV